MNREEPYGVEKDLKVVRGSSKRHQARLEGQYLGIFPSMEVPSIPDEEGKKEEEPKKKRLKDPRLFIGIDTENLPNETFWERFLSVLGWDPREGDFDVLSTMELTLRALAKARFKNLAKLEVGGKTIYEHPEKEWDLKEVLESYAEIVKKDDTLEEASALVYRSDDSSLGAKVNVDRIHTQFTHDIRIDFEGVMEEEYLNRVINYLEDHLELDYLLEK